MGAVVSYPVGPAASLGSLGVVRKSLRDFPIMATGVHPVDHGNHDYKKPAPQKKFPLQRLVGGVSTADHIET